MAARNAARQLRAQSSIKPTGPDTAALDYAVRLIHQVCCFAGSFDLVEEFRDQALCAAVERHDSAVLFDRQIYSFSFQGISDQIAINYMQRHGQATWRSVRKNLAKQPTYERFAKLASCARFTPQAIIFAVDRSALPFDCCATATHR
jgi:hypothetical protein